MLSTPFEFQIVFTPKPTHRTESTTLALSLQKFSRTAVMQIMNTMSLPRHLQQALAARLRR
jgi:hypothetical protein